MSQGSARYERSMGGMVGAMIVTLLVIGAFVVFRAINRDDLVVEREAVDYLETVQALQEAGGVDPAYPPSLPRGWIATRAAYQPENLAWELDLLTATGHYLGLRQATMRDKDLVEEYADEEGEPDGVTGFDSGVATEWTGWLVKDGDTAWTAPLGVQRGDEPNPALEKGAGQVVLVFGSAPKDEVRTFIESLVQDPVER